MHPAHVRPLAAAGLAAAFLFAGLLAGAAALQAQTQAQFEQARTDCEDGFNDSPAADSCTFTSVAVSSSVVIVNGAPDMSTLTWMCEIAASCTVARDGGSSETVSLRRGIPLAKVSGTTLDTDSEGRDILSYPGASNEY